MIDDPPAPAGCWVPARARQLYHDQTLWFVVPGDWRLVSTSGLMHSVPSMGRMRSNVAEAQ